MVLALGMSRPDSTMVVESSTSYLRLVEGRHAVLDFARRHLAVRRDEADFRHFHAQKLFHLGHVGDAWNDKIGLAAASNARAAGPPAARRRPAGHDVGAHREAVDRRRLDDAEFAQAAHRHLQRTRDRRRCEGQNMDVGLELLEGAPCERRRSCSSSTMTRPRRLNSSPLASSACVPMTMSTVPSARPVPGRFGFRRADEAREAADLQRESAKALLEIEEMLAGKKGCRGK